MKLSEVEIVGPVVSTDVAGDLLQPLIDGQPSKNADAGSFSGVVVGELVAINDDRSPLVTFPGRTESRAVAARTTVSLSAADIGKQVVLVFEGSDSTRPIVLGVLRHPGGSALEMRPNVVEVDADDQILTISAREQVVLRCGKASITLTKAGKILIEGTYLLSRSSGAHRIKGGSVQIN